MKNRIYGRKVGNTGEMVLLFESDGTASSSNSKKVSPDVLADFVVASAPNCEYSTRTRR